MDKLLEVNKFIDTPELDIVANAMMKTYWRFIQKGKMKTNTQQEENEIGMMFEQITSGMCFNASVEMARFLTEEHKDNFETIMIITTHDILEDSPIRENIDKNGFHSYILIKDKNGIWYATSPANHNMTIKSSKQAKVKDNEYATTLFFDSSLTAVLEKIKNRDGFQLPNETDILSNLRDNTIPEILDGNRLKIFEIIRHKNKIVPKFTTVPRFTKIESI